MSDLISRQDVIKAVTYGALSSATLFGRSDEGMTALRETVRAIKALPSVQPLKGKWLKAGTRMGIPLFECSLCECGDEVPTVMGKPSYNFCPYCGADMRGDSDD